MPTLLFERGLAGGAGRLPPLPQHRLRRAVRAGLRAPHRRRPAGDRLRPRRRLPAGRGRGTEAEGADCSGARAGNLYIQYWTYYADSATLRGVPIVGDEGFHRDDWEGVQIRIRPDGAVDERASSHNGYNYRQRRSPTGARTPASARSGTLTEAVGLRAENGWGPETHLLLVSGGSHAGNAGGIPDVDRFTPRRRVHLVPLEPIAATELDRFAITPPWRKQVWRDPEAEGTD